MKIIVLELTNIRTVPGELEDTRACKNILFESPDIGTIRHKNMLALTVEKSPFKITKMDTFILQRISAVSTLFVVKPFCSLPTAQKPFTRTDAYAPVNLQVTASVNR